MSKSIEYMVHVMQSYEEGMPIERRPKWITLGGWIPTDHPY